MSISAFAINTAWMLRCRSDWHRFLADTKRVKETQATYLKNTLDKNADTKFGRRHGFASIDSAQSYQQRVPLMNESDLEVAVAAISEGASSVLTREPVLLLQPTSGSTRATKWIPYTKSLRNEYQRMVSSWIGNLYWEVPKVRLGLAYWSISPAGLTNQRTPSGIPIGFDDDTEYLGLVEKWLARRVLAVSSTVSRETDIERFRYLTLLYLLRAGELALISIWSPTFLSALLDQLSTQSESLVRDIHNGIGCCSHAGDIHPLLRVPNPRRARHLENIFSKIDSQESIYGRVWPKLALISCWMDGSSSGQASRLQSQMLGVRFQAKGLLATEACVSFPVVGHDGCALAIRSHFFEFYSFPPMDDQVYLADQLLVGRQYTLVVTTGGGLYRYPLHDIVEVTGKLNQCPLLRFVGRGNQTTDLVGEKLQESFVQKCIASTLAEQKITPSFAMLLAIPQNPTQGETENSVCHYRLQVETDSVSFDCQRLGSELDNRLKDNIHYKYARELGQLGPIVVDPLPGPAGTAWAEYEKKQASKGQIIGSVKPKLLAYADARMKKTGCIPIDPNWSIEKGGN